MAALPPDSGNIFPQNTKNNKRISLESYKMAKMQKLELSSLDLNHGNGVKEECYYCEIKFEKRSTGSTTKISKKFDFTGQPGKLLPTIGHSFKAEVAGNLICIDENVSSSIVANARKIFIKSVHILRESELTSTSRPKSRKLVTKFTQFTRASGPDRFYWQYEDKEEVDLSTLNIQIVVVQIPKNEDKSKYGLLVPVKLRYIAPENSIYYLSKEFADIMINCGEIKIPAHRFVICKNPVFEKMLQPLYKEGQENLIKIPSEEASTIKQFLQYLYFKHIELDCRSAQALLPVADKYMELDLKYDCERILAEKLCEKHVFSVLRRSLKFNAKNLTTACKIFLKEHRHELLNSPEQLKRRANEFPEMVFFAMS